MRRTIQYLTKKRLFMYLVAFMAVGAQVKLLAVCGKIAGTSETGPCNDSCTHPGDCYQKYAYSDPNGDNPVVVMCTCGPANAACIDHEPIVTYDTVYFFVSTYGCNNGACAWGNCIGTGDTPEYTANNVREVDTSFSICGG